MKGGKVMLSFLQSLLGNKQQQQGPFPNGRYPQQRFSGQRRPPQNYGRTPNRWQNGPGARGNMMPPRGNLPGPPQTGNSGGFLSKLFGSGTGNTDMVGMLNNVQSVLKTAESVAPMIQQYGPMVKNLPAMLQMLKEFQNMDENEVDSEAIDTDESELDLDKESEDVKKSTKKTKKSTGKRQEHVPMIEDQEFIESENQMEFGSEPLKTKESKPKLYF